MSVIDKEEDAYVRGSRMAWRRIAGMAAAELQDPEVSALCELEDARQEFRDLMAELGIDYPADLHLGDAIENYLRRHLRGK